MSPSGTVTMSVQARLHGIRLLRLAAKTRSVRVARWVYYHLFRVEYRIDGGAWRPMDLPPFGWWLV